MTSIQLHNVTKRFGTIPALDNVSLAFEENKIYGLLGRNGAGKSTLLNIITNRLFADSGEVTVQGKRATENDRAQKQVFLMSEKDYSPESMRVTEIFRWTKEFYGIFDMEYAYRLCELFQLNPKKKVKELSTGYNSITKIIVALSVGVPFVLLDEPVLGLDANHRELFYQLLLENYSDNPRTFVISTHLIEEISGLIEDIIILKEGKIIRNESCEELLRSGYTVSGASEAVERYAAGKRVIGSDTLGGLKSFYILGKPESPLPDGLELSKLDLQKLFIQLTNS